MTALLNAEIPAKTYQIKKRAKPNGLNSIKKTGSEILDKNLIYSLR